MYINCKVILDYYNQRHSFYREANCFSLCERAVNVCALIPAVLYVYVIKFRIKIILKSFCH